jgi:hypothetical protein
MGSRRHGGDRTEGRHIMTEGSRPHCTVPELEAVLGKTHRTEFEGGRLETWVMVGLGTRSAIERAESGNSQPKTARASALPDTCDETSFGGCVDSLFLPFLTFEPETQAEIDQKWPKTPGKHLQNAHEMPVLVVM